MFLLEWFVQKASQGDELSLRGLNNYDYFKKSTARIKPKPVIQSFRQKEPQHKFKPTKGIIVHLPVPLVLFSFKPIRYFSSLGAF